MTTSNLAQVGVVVPVRIALVGAGIFMQDAHLPSLLRRRSELEIVAVYSRSAASAERLAQQLPAAVRIYTDYDALLADATIEAVDIVLPIPVMASHVAAALASGKHVISEKPIAIDSATALDLLAAYNQRVAIHAQQVWMVAENWRYESAFVRAAELIRSGAIGTPVTCYWAIHTTISPSSKYYGSAWRESGDLPGGYLLDGGVHHAAGFRLLVGEISSVNATIKQVAPHLPPADTIAAQLRFANGAIGVYLASFGVGAPFPPDLHVVGDAGALRMQRGEVEVTRAGKTETFPYPKYDGVEEELVAFAAAIRQQRPHVNTPEEGLRDLAVIEALLQSAADGVWKTVAAPG